MLGKTQLKCNYLSKSRFVVRNKEFVFLCIVTWWVISRYQYPGGNGNLILWSLRVPSNWVLFISWKEGELKGTSFHVAHFPCTTAMYPALCHLFYKKKKKLTRLWKKELVHFRCQLQCLYKLGPVGNCIILRYRGSIQN